jgi:uncharacterized phage protein gp47/JayE
MAVIIAVPLPADVTRPAVETRATVVSEEVQVTGASPKTTPPASVTVAINRSVSLRASNAIESADRAIESAIWATVI